MKPQEVFFWSLTFWSYFKSIRTKKSTFPDFMSHVTTERTQRPRADRLMKTQEAFSYSLWRNESTFRDFIFHIPNGYKERPINESPRSILLFALALFIYLYFYYFAKRKVLFEISYVTTFWITYSLFLFKWKPWPRLTQTQQYTDRELSISPISQHTQWRIMKTFQCVSISDTHHSTRLYTLFYIIRTLPSIIPEEIIISQY